MLQQQTHAGELAFELKRNEEAAAQYRTALSRAQARDDPDAIGDTGYNLAVAELRANGRVEDWRASRPRHPDRATFPAPSTSHAACGFVNRHGIRTPFSG
jgi:hypothetical protein